MTTSNLREGSEAATVTQFGWLIETAGGLYLGVRKLGGHEFFWTNHHERALRFKDREQADLTMMAVRRLNPELFVGHIDYKAVEHGWSGDVASKETT